MQSKDFAKSSLKGHCTGKTEYRRTASFAFKTNIHIIRRQEHHNTTQNKRRLLFGLNVDYIYCIKELIFRLGIRGFLRAELT